MAAVRTISVAVGLFVVLALVPVACGDADDRSSETPGFSGSEREVDRSPFELATPTTGDGPTTIPGGPTVPGEVTLPDGEVTEFTTTTTTTTLPDTIAEPNSSDLVCRSFFVAASAIREAQNLAEQDAQRPGSVSYAEVRDMMVRSFNTAAAQIAAGVPSEAVVDVPTALMRRLRSTATYISQSSSFADGGSLLAPLIVEPPQPGEPLGWPEIEGFLAGTCPELLVALTGRPTLT